MTRVIWKMIKDKVRNSALILFLFPIAAGFVVSTRLICLVMLIVNGVARS